MFPEKLNQNSPILFLPQLLLFNRTVPLQQNILKNIFSTWLLMSNKYKWSHTVHDKYNN
jgi:hypothetical protein